MKKLLKNKKIVIGIILIILIIVGYMVVNSIIKNKNDNIEDRDLVVLQKVKYRLNQPEYEYGIHYRVARNFRKAKLPNYITYYSEGIEDNPYFQITIYRYTDKKMKEVIKRTVGKYNKKKKEKIRDIEYTVFYSKDLLKHDVKTYYYKNKDTNTMYVYSFKSNINISKLERVFLEGIEY